MMSRLAGENEMPIFDTGGSFNPDIDPHRRTKNLAPFLNPQKALQKGTLYIGHRPIGFGANTSAAPLFTTINLRDPLSLLKSLYSFKLTVPPRNSKGFHHDEVKHLKAEQQRLRVLMFEDSNLMDYHVKNHDGVIIRMLRNACFSTFLMPLSCWDRATSYMEVLAISLQNLLKVDIVATEKQLVESYEAQLKYHAPHLQFQNWAVPSAAHLNTGTGDKQVLTAEAIAIIESWPEFRVNTVLYTAAKQISAARDARAKKCALEQQSTESCQSDAKCHLHMGNNGADLTKQEVPVGCGFPRVAVR
jgi:hypothetical protein